MDLNYSKKCKLIFTIAVSYLFSGNFLMAAHAKKNRLVDFSNEKSGFVEIFNDVSNTKIDPKKATYLIDYEISNISGKIPWLGSINIPLELNKSFEFTFNNNMQNTIFITIKDINGTTIWNLYFEINLNEEKNIFIDIKNEIKNGKFQRKLDTYSEGFLKKKSRNGREFIHNISHEELSGAIKSKEEIEKIKNEIKRIEERIQSVMWGGDY